MYSAKERTTLAAPHCWSTPLRPTGHRSASLTGGKTQLFDGRDGAGPADAGQRCHPTLQQSLGAAGSNGKEKRR